MTRIKSVLVPTDFSDTSDAALRHAIDIAQTFGARLYLLHVPGAIGEHLEADFPLSEFEATVHRLLTAFVTPDELARLKPEYVLRVGATAEQIVRYAEERDVDLIVMGTHGRTGMAHLLMGSVAEQVVRTAPCPVTLVRAAKHPAKQPRVATGVSDHAPVAII